MKTIIKSPVIIGQTKITIIPNFQGCRGFYNKKYLKYNGKYGITIEHDGHAGDTKELINDNLSKAFGCDITLAQISNKAIFTYQEGEYDGLFYFAAILRVGKLNELIK